MRVTQSAQPAAAALPEGMVAAFAEIFGQPPQGAGSAPGRVNLIGEHTDYNQGLVLPIALPQRTYALAARRNDRTLRLASLDIPGEPQVIALDAVGPGRPSGWTSYVAGVVWAMERAGYEVSGLDLLVVSWVPIGAGLSSSAALEAAVAAAVCDVFGLDLLLDDQGRKVLAELCRQAENEVAQAPTGGMDQAASLRCEAGSALLLDCRDDSVEQVPFDLATHDLSLLVVDTRAEHALVDGQYGNRRTACEQAAGELGVTSLREIDPAGLEGALDTLSSAELRKRTRHVVTEIERVRQSVTALRHGDFARVGELFGESHASMRDDFEISCPELDLTVSTAVRAGALGARMTGGGFGGSAIAIVAAGQAAAISEAVVAAFAEAGFAKPACFTVRAAQPASVMAIG